MGIPVTSASATLVSVSNPSDLYTLTTGMRLSEFSFSLDADEFDVSQLDGSTVCAENLVGLMAGTVSFSGYYDKSSPMLGNAGLVTYAGGYSQYVTDWKIDVDFGEIDITALAVSAPVSKNWMPGGLPKWSGSYNAHAVDDTAVSKPTAAGSLGSSATFNVSATKTLAGNIFAKSLSHAVRKADKQVLAYSFTGSGNITEAGIGTSIRGNGAWPRPTYTASTPAVIFKTYEAGGTDRTYAGNAFLKSISIEVPVAAPVKISGQLRFFGDITTT